MRKPAADRLRQHLVVEHEIVRTARQRQRLEHLPAPARDSRCGTRTACVPISEILQQRQHAIGDVLVERHAARQRAAAQNARAQHDVVTRPTRSLTPSRSPVAANTDSPDAASRRCRRRAPARPRSRSSDCRRSRGCRLCTSVWMPSARASAVVLSELASSVRMMSSTTSFGISSKVRRSVCSAL